MIFHRAAILSGAIIASAFLATSPAQGRRIVIDQGEFISPGTLGTACTIGGAACSPTTLPFSFDFGGGQTNLAYIYDTGIVSFGAPISAAIDPFGPFTDFGVPVIAPLYDPAAIGVAGAYQAGARIFEPFEFNETLDNFGTDLFLISFLDPSTVDNENFLAGYVHLILDASATELRFEFIHGESNTQDGNTVTALPNVAGTRLGYSIAGQQLSDTTPNISGVNAFSISTSAAVPEPGTWAMMLIGFGAVGYAMRRRKAYRKEIVLTL